MPECNFCGEDFRRGTGMMFVKKDGKVLYFCSRKCEKNLLKLNRKPRVTTWTKEFHRVKKATKAGEKK